MFINMPNLDFIRIKVLSLKVALLWMNQRAQLKLHTRNLMMFSEYILKFDIINEKKKMITLCQREYINWI